MSICLIVIILFEVSCGRFFIFFIKVKMMVVIFLVKEFEWGIINVMVFFDIWIYLGRVVCMLIIVLLIFMLSFVKERCIVIMLLFIR